ncbi:uncharacterized protein LOC131219440 isoform X1 [Magnolia sinica]|uniref:uncharacterized protein LOC131219440 isoform X1 n=1 Tax=Magnolia sinica TaxID=86752 RepID=UPI002658DC61|nr:uncharacterized protein LOC131219440 isoform X1 [Magnolia sinica]
MLFSNLAVCPNIIQYFVFVGRQGWCTRIKILEIQRQLTIQGCQIPQCRSLPNQSIHLFQEAPDPFRRLHLLKPLLEHQILQFLLHHRKEMRLEHFLFSLGP